jgi:plasmid stability protein
MSTVSVQVPDDIRRYLEMRAACHGLTMENLLRQAVALYVRAAEHREKQKR